MITIDVLTTTRAEYGLLRPLLRQLQASEAFQMNLLVTGTHLDSRFGLTYHEILNDGFEIYYQKPILGNNISANFVSETMAKALTEFSTFFIKEKPDFLLVDGDRYETMAICVAAFNANIPIIHLCGGATTEGAADEFYRHAITKMAYLHFPTTEIYRKRIIQMGEDPNRVFSV
ncbi:MAG: UDP-N-acetylglucosamine 2-epimerase, partial [Bacteroidota bacterium]|nr:UDP-N-acetylglucosamine 2-epimerase [Bacteroidota bacterium]